MLLPGEYFAREAGARTELHHCIGFASPVAAAIGVADDIFQSIFSGDVYEIDVEDSHGAHHLIKLRGEIKTLWTRVEGDR